jgi:hypothetical protein
MNQGTQGYSLTKKTEGRKSRDTVSLTPLTGKIVNTCLREPSKLILVEAVLTYCTYKMSLTKIDIIQLIVVPSLFENKITTPKSQNKDRNLKKNL